MPEWLLVVIGFVLALAVLGGVFYVAFKPRKRGRGSRLAPRSGNRDIDDITGVSSAEHSPPHSSD